MIGTMTKNLMKILMKIGRRTFEKIYRNKLLIYYRKRKNLRKLKLQIKLFFEYIILSNNCKDKFNL